MDNFDEVIKIVSFIVLLWGCFEFSRIYFSYDPNKPNAKYITVKNDFLARLLIAKPSRKNKDSISESDRNKLSLISLITYIIQAILVIVFVILQIVPSIPCEPFKFSFWKRGGIMLYTLNDKIPLILIMLLFVIEMLFKTLSIIITITKDKKKKTETRDVLSFIVIAIIAVALSVYLVIHLFV